MQMAGAMSKNSASLRHCKNQLRLHLSKKNFIKWQRQ